MTFKTGFTNYSLLYLSLKYKYYKTLFWSHSVMWFFNHSFKNCICMLLHAHLSFKMFFSRLERERESKFVSKHWNKHTNTEWILSSTADFGSEEGTEEAFFLFSWGPFLFFFPVCNCFTNALRFPPNMLRHSHLSHLTVSSPFRLRRLRALESSLKLLLAVSLFTLPSKYTWNLIPYHLPCYYLVGATIFSSLSHCNGLLYGFPSQWYALSI